MAKAVELSYEAYRFQIHTCKADHHHHIITGPENVSWPFWSYEAALKMIDQLRWMIGPSVTPAEELKVEELRREVLRLGRAQSRDQRGRFGTLLMPRRLLYREGPVADMWGALGRRENTAAYCLDQEIIGDVVTPLYCDFIHRNEPRPTTPLTMREWAKLAEMPVKILTAKEMGIEFQLSE